MTTARDALLPALDITRAVGGLLGLRVFTVTVRQRTWTGERPGVGSKSDVDILLTNQLTSTTPEPIYVRQLTRQEAIASGGLYTNRDLRVGPVTPPYPPGFGFDDGVIDPAPSASTVELFWLVTGPGLPPSGGWFNKLGEEATSLHRHVILRANGRQP